MPRNTTNERKAFRRLNRVEQIIGREGETATLLLRCLFNSELRGFGFAPRQLRRWAAFLAGYDLK